MDTFRTWMHFLRVNLAFYNAVITTANPFPYTAKFMFFGVRNNKNSTSQVLKDRQNTYIVVYQKYLSQLGEMATLYTCFLYTAKKNIFS